MGLWCTEGTRSAQPDWVCAADLTLPHKGGSTRRAQPPCVRPLHKKGSPAGHTQHSRACFVPHRGTPVPHILSLMGLQGSAFPPERAFWRAHISQRGRLRGGRVPVQPREEEPRPPHNHQANKTTSRTGPENHFLWKRPPRPSSATFDRTVRTVLLLLALPTLPWPCPDIFCFTAKPPVR